MKKDITIFTIIIIALIIFEKIYSVHIEYTISNNIIEIKQGIENSMQRGKESNKTFDIEIKETINIDNNIYVAFTIKGRTGSAELTKGINGKYKISSLRYGDSLYICEVYETNKGKYIIVTSKNYGLKAYYAKVTLLECDNPVPFSKTKSTEYILEIPQQDYYISCKKIPNKLADNIALEICLLNKEKRDITSEMLKLHR